MDDDYVGSELTPSFAISQATDPKLRAHLQKAMGVTTLPAAEQADLATFSAEAFVQARHVLAHGGEKAMAVKAQITNAIAANNIHSQGASE